MAVTAQKVSNRVRELISDKAGVRWEDPELLMWISDGRRELASYLPAVFSKTAKITHTLGDGAFQQVDSQSAFAITAVSHNIESGGAVGRAIRETTTDLMDAFKPGWRSESGNCVQNWMRDVLNPVAFWVFPSVSGGKVSVTLRLSPQDVTAMTDDALPFEQYLNPLVNYVLHRVYAKDAEVAQNAALSAAYLQLFLNFVSSKEK